MCAIIFLSQVQHIDLVDFSPRPMGGPSLYRPAAGTLEEICGMSGLDLTGAY